MNGDGSTGLTLLLIGLVIYLLPTVVAGARGHSNTLAIFVLNLLLGWTVLGWILALIWAFTSVAQPARIDRRKTRKCAQCAEMILADAKKCKHCGSTT